jgi:hypothetical protein
MFDMYIYQEKRDPFPGSFSIEGATGKSPTRINGVYEPTKEAQNGFPVYRKKGDGETWVEIVFKPETGWRWYLKPTANKGPDSSICFAYFQCSEENVMLPHDCSSWHVSTADGFKEQPTVVKLASNAPIPSSVTAQFKEGLKNVKERRDTRRTEVRNVIGLRYIHLFSCKTRIFV